METKQTLSRFKRTDRFIPAGTSQALNCLGIAAILLPAPIISVQADPEM